MNLVHLKYAVEVAETGSINKASEKLYVSQPNLSRAIKRARSEPRVTIFDRSAKGMVLTPDGGFLFVTPARYSVRSTLSKKCSARVRPRRKNSRYPCQGASYVTDAFAEFSKLLDKDTPVEIFYKETNSMRSMKNILQDEYKLCIIPLRRRIRQILQINIRRKGLTYEAYNRVSICSAHE